MTDHLHLFLQTTRLIIATHNAGKLAEFASILKQVVKGTIVSAGELGLPEPEETGASFAENARIKATMIAAITGSPALADDSGLCVTALNDAPGIYSARWAGEPRNFKTAMEKIHTELGSSTDRSAYFIAALALALPDGRMIESEGRVTGTLVWPPRGTKGHGYDPIFQPDGFNLTFGEMDEGEKNAMSHRSRALDSLMKKISETTFV